MQVVGIVACNTVVEEIEAMQFGEFTPALLVRPQSFRGAGLLFIY